jgi:hypothetical protein
LTTTSLETLGAEVSLKHLEELLDHSRLAQSLPRADSKSGTGGLAGAVSMG